MFAREPGWQFSLMLALDVLFLFVAIPALAAGEVPRNVITLLQLVLASVAIALVARAAWLRVGLAAMFGLGLLARLLPGLLPQTATLAVVFAYNLLVTLVMARAVFGPGKINHHRIAGAVFIYLNIAILFGLAYGGLTLLVPGALSGLPPASPNHISELIHFSFTTLTAIGGDNVLPVSPLARSLADLETITGQLFPAILLSRLVGLHLSQSE